MRTEAWTGALAVGLLASGCGGDFSFFGGADPVDPTALRTDVFQQVARPRHDFLWIIDNTTSMASKQALLTEVYRSFFAQLQTSGVAYQVGITVIDLASGGGRLLGDPWIVTPETPGGRDLFVDTARVELAEEARNQGLEAMRIALTPPTSTGANRGFLRPGADLSIYVVSDSDDTSVWPGTDEDVDLVTYEALLEGLSHGDAAPRFNAIVGPAGTGCQVGTQSAISGDRYVALAEATAGAVISICEPEDPLAQVPLSVPDRLRAFSLSAQPVSQQLAVWVDASRVDDGDFSLDGATLTFKDSAIPDYDAQIRIQYLERVEEAP